MGQSVMRSRSSSAKRHCMVVHNYYPLGEIRVQREARALIDAGFEVDVICLRHPGECAQASEYKVQIYRLPVKRYKQRGVVVQLLEYLVFFFLATWQLLRLYLKKRYTTIQIHNLPDFLVFAAIIPKLLGARVILDIHDLMPEFYAVRFGSDMNRLPVKLVKFQEKVACRFADQVITVTEAWRQTLIKRGVSGSKCGVVMNLPDPKIFYVADGSSKKTQSTTNGSIRLFYHGNVTYRYGLDVLVKAFAKAREELPEVHLVIHGRGDYQNQLKDLISQLGVDQAVTLSTELIPLEDVVPLIRTADLSVVPYRYDIFSDGILPTKLMEYAILGIPTIASTTTAIQTYFDKEMVYFVPFDNVSALAEAIVKVIKDKELLGTLAKNITKFNQLHNWQREAGSYVHMVKALDSRVSR